jgi:hypothetical protein
MTKRDPGGLWQEPARRRTCAGFAFAEAVAREIVFIDPHVDDLATLLQGLRPGLDAILLNDKVPAPAQIADALARESAVEAVELDRGRRARPVAAIHIIAHGRKGEVSFAAGALSLGNLSEHEAELVSIRAALGGAPINLWSCHTGKGEAGEAFLEALGREAGTRIAASDGPVGAAGRGGSWELRAGAPGVPPIEAPLTAAGVEAIRE